MKRYLKYGGLCLVIFFILCSQSNVSAIDLWRENILKFGNVLHITHIETNPEVILPGMPATLDLKLENTGSESLKNIIVTIALPDKIMPFNDITQKKIDLLGARESEEVHFNIIALPDIGGTVHNATISVTYLNIIGDQKSDSGIISIMVGGTPRIFATIESSEIYKGKNIGDVSILFVNNEIADIKFLTVELIPSEDYEIIGQSKEYIGDLDSDDFESVSFRLNVKTKEEKISLPLILTYKDALNRDYIEEMDLTLVKRSPEELGISKDKTAIIIFIIGVIAIVAYIIYKKYKKKNAKRLS